MLAYVFLAVLLSLIWALIIVPGKPTSRQASSPPTSMPSSSAEVEMTREADRFVATIPGGAAVNVGRCSNGWCGTAWPSYRPTGRVPSRSP